MPFWERSPKSKYNAEVKKILRKEDCSLPTQTKPFHNLMHSVSMLRNSRAKRASLTASLTLEAALILPLFLYVLIGVLSFVPLIGRAGAMTGSIHDTAKQMGVYAYVADQVGGKAEKSGLIEGGISAAYASACLQESAKGLSNFHLLYSTFLGEEEQIDLVVSYRIGNSIPVLSFGNPQVIQRGYVRAWTGRDFRKEAEKNRGEEELVYVTEHGTVYHRSLECTHLNLSIQSVSTSIVGSLRNRYGAIYYACSCCKAGTGASVYITDTGTRYHASLSCSGLTRSIRSVPLSEVGSLPPCSRCGGK